MTAKVSSCRPAAPFEGTQSQRCLQQAMCRGGGGGRLHYNTVLMFVYDRAQSMPISPMASLVSTVSLCVKGFLSVSWNMRTHMRTHTTKTAGVRVGSFISRLSHMTTLTS